ncbi:hypothetical protein EV586_103238 [Tumebacillus sp. BK434]|uniref:hypothetical protein n=1 Tax=Tumebacillus sp. BK434 TaxID=2512169 RepID=UPI001051B219|nr:hypothetical protein [Tumebacillus sp. BK434]TCP55585.1 hypothetical protein EV586_103238 [Tumebacillus sp. BK434]
MKKFSKLLLAAAFATTVVAGVGCGSEATTDKPAAEAPKKEDAEKTYKAVFAAAVIAEEKLQSQFSTVKGLEGDKEVTFSKPAKSKDEALKFLGTYWDSALADKEYSALLGDKALLDQANKAIEALAKKNKKDFKAETEIAKAEAIRANALSATAKYEDAKVEAKDGNYALTYKGLTYTVKKDGNSYKVINKEGTLAK